MVSESVNAVKEAEQGGGLAVTGMRMGTAEGNVPLYGVIFELSMTGKVGGGQWLALHNSRCRIF